MSGIQVAVCAHSICGVPTIEQSRQGTLSLWQDDGLTSEWSAIACDRTNGFGRGTLSVVGLLSS